MVVNPFLDLTVPSHPDVTQKATLDAYFTKKTDERQPKTASFHFFVQTIVPISIFAWFTLSPGVTRLRIV